MQLQGMIEAKGTYDELQTTGKDFAKLLSSSHDEDEDKKSLEKPLPLSRRTSARVRDFFFVILLTKVYFCFFVTSYN